MAIRATAAAVCIVALLPCGTAAQAVGGGVKGGLALGDVPNIDEEVTDVSGVSTDRRIGFAAGGFLTWRFESGLAIQPEVLYTQKGVKVTGSEGGVSAEIRLKTDFVDVPILARYTFGKVVRGYLFAGPSFDFKVSAKVEMQALGQSEEEEISDDVESFEFALVFGGGVELGPLLVEGRWSEGLTDLAKESDGEGPTDIKTRTILFLAGFRF